MTDSDEKASRFTRDSNDSPQSRRGRGRGRGGRGGRVGKGKTGGGRGPSRGGGRGLQGKNIGEKASSSDEDVMIEFMHVMRGGDEKAKQIFIDYGNPKSSKGQSIFVQQVRKFLIERTMKENENDMTEIHSNDLSKAQTAVDVEGEVIMNTMKKNINDAPKPYEANQDDKDGFEHVFEKLSMTSNTERNSSGNQTSNIQSISQEMPKSRLSAPPPGLGHMNSNVYSSPGIILKNNNLSSDMLTPGSTKPDRVQAVVPSEPLQSVNDQNTTEKVDVTKAAPKWQPKRFLTRIQDQPGKLLVDKQPATVSGYPHVILSTRKEFVATWSLPLQYLQKRTLQKLQQKQEQALQEAKMNGEGEITAASIKAPENLTIRDALQSLTVGLFRRGSPENGSNHSIVSKQVVPNTDVNDALNNKGGSMSPEYHFEINHQTGLIYGTVPFYTPRTPGNVVLRLYFDEDAPITLATSTCIKVVVHNNDLEHTLRFILSNFKSRKGASISAGISCIHSLASVLEQLQPSTNHHQSPYRRNDNNSSMDGAGRATWGCICESKKIVDSFKLEYLEKKEKLDKRIDDLDAEYRDLLENDEHGIMEQSEIGAEAEQKLNDSKEKRGSLMVERASNERKWRELQIAFASVLSAIINNPCASVLLKHDIVLKMRLEYELWCELCESFAPNPFEIDDEEKSNGAIDNLPARTIKYPQPITHVHINKCKQSCAKMQKEILGFVPIKNMFSVIEHSKKQVPSEGPSGTSLCANLSKAMETIFNTEYVPSLESIQMKIKARDLTQSAVTMSEIFPNGTKVVIFGSSANGFGSQTSDLDMCLELPPTSSMNDFEGENGSTAMANLAEKLEEIGMVDVDKARLTARIPVIKFFCPIKLSTPISTGENDVQMIECDISMQNPLAVINTALLRNYSVFPEVRILVAIIKRWAKSRDINNPSNHTLSSYGYILMLLHFLTTHKASNDAIEMMHSKTNHGKVEITGCPIVPNLQWMNPNWLHSDMVCGYEELLVQPKNQYTMMQHPSEDSFLVNKYFFQIASDEALINNIRQRVYYHQSQTNHPSQGKPLIGRILASFYHYYAFEFDYKKHIVTLQSHRHGTIEREAKGENDGWKVYSQTLCIEDPFETFYDVAHVLKPATFSRMRREFALAYTKIAQSFHKHNVHNDLVESDNFGERLLDSICEEIKDTI